MTMKNAASTRLVVRDLVNQSVAGEEDPGAAADFVSPAVDARRKAQGPGSDAVMLRKAIARWENEGGAEPDGPEAIASPPALPDKARRE